MGLVIPPAAKAQTVEKLSGTLVNPKRLATGCSFLIPKEIGPIGIMITISKTLLQTNQSMLKTNLVHVQRIGSKPFAHHDWISWDLGVIAMTVVMVMLPATAMVMTRTTRWPQLWAPNQCFQRWRYDWHLGRPWVVGSISFATEKQEDQTAGRVLFFDQNCDWSDKHWKLKQQTFRFANTKSWFYKRESGSIQQD